MHDNSAHTYASRTDTTRDWPNTSAGDIFSFYSIIKDPSAGVSLSLSLLRYVPSYNVRRGPIDIHTYMYEIVWKIYGDDDPALKRLQRTRGPPFEVFEKLIIIIIILMLMRVRVCIVDRPYGI